MTHQPTRDPLADLSAQGVAVWLDDLSRELLADARLLFERLAAAGVNIDEVTEQLEREGLDKFGKSWDELAATVAAELGRYHPATRS